MTRSPEDYSLIETYCPDDIAQITAREDFAALLADDPFEGRGPLPACTWSLTRGEARRVVACGGYVRDRRGVFSLWGYCGGDVTRREWVMIAHRVREIIADLFAKGAHRVHAVARADHAAAVKFLIHMGLLNDMNRLTAMGPDGEDYVMLAALKEFRS